MPIPLMPHAIRCVRERGKRAVAIAREVARSRVLRKGLPELLRGPKGGRMCGDRDATHAATPHGTETEPPQAARLNITASA